MKHTVLASAVALLAATGAMAGSLSDPVPAPMPTVPMPVIADWSGFYAGATAGLVSGDVTLNPAIPGPTFAISDGTVYGGFAGYNFQNGNVVYGVELGAQMGNMTVAALGFDIDYLIDARARVGYSMGDAMIYAAGGYSAGKATLSGVPAATGTASGWNVGGGLEVNISDNMFIGGEYIYRDMSGDYLGTPIDVNLNTIQLKIGMRF